MSKKNEAIDLSSIKDVADFFNHWNDIRPIAVKASKKQKLSCAERKTLSWLITLADRITERDIFGC